MIVPGIVVTLLLGVEISGAAGALARCFGIALLALGLACWPGVENSRQLPAMLLYNAGIAFYLLYLGTVAQLGGVLLWPAVVLHTAITGAFLRLRKT